MKKVEIKKLAGVGVLSLGLVFGMAGFAGAQTASIDGTGNNSENEISYESEVEMEVENKNDLNLHNDTDQYASSGEAEVKDNRNGGSARSGNAANTSHVSASIAVDNSQSATGMTEALGDLGSVEMPSASISDTGNYSENEVEFESEVELEVENYNDIYINNDVNQVARSGDAEVEDNRNAGNAVTGNVSNTSTTSFTVHVTN